MWVIPGPGSYSGCTLALFFFNSIKYLFCFAIGVRGTPVGSAMGYLPKALCRIGEGAAL